MDPSVDWAQGAGDGLGRITGAGASSHDTEGARRDRLAGVQHRYDDLGTVWVLPPAPYRVLGYREDGGAPLVGRPFGEGSLLRLARSYEAQQAFAARVPRSGGA
jgi:hypothetical protein